MSDEEPQVESPSAPAAAEPEAEPAKPPASAPESPPASKPSEPAKPPVSEPAKPQGSVKAFGLVGTFLVAAVLGLTALAVWRSLRKPRSAGSRSPEPFDSSLGL